MCHMYGNIYMFMYLYLENMFIKKYIDDLTQNNLINRSFCISVTTYLCIDIDISILYGTAVSIIAK